MEGKDILKFVFRCVLPAGVISLAIIYAGLASSQLALAFAAAYVLGYAILSYADSIGLKKTPIFYLLYASLAIAGVLIGAGAVSLNISSFGRVLIPFGISFIVPAMFEIGLGLINNVQRE